MGLTAALTRASSRFAERLSERTYLQDRDYQQVQVMIDEAHQEFLKAERRMRQLRKEYHELGCEVVYGDSP